LQMLWELAFEMVLSSEIADHLLSFPKWTFSPFDKTGTLTDGEMRVARHYISHNHILPIISALVKGQKHPISRAVATFVEEQIEALCNIEKDVQLDKGEVVPGQRLRTRYNSYPLLGGNASFARAPSSSTATQGDCSEFCVSLGSRLLAKFELRDSLRSGSKELVEVLQSLRKQVVLISGDLEGLSIRVGAELAISPDSVHGNCDPSQKMELLKSMQAAGKRVCFVGDGINDTPALGIANVSIAIGDGTDAAQATADIIVNTRASIKVPILGAIKLGDTCSAHVRLALAWAVLYNVFAVLLASGAFVNFRIEPQWAGLAEIVSLLPVFVIAYAARWTWKRGTFSKKSLRMAS